MKSAYKIMVVAGESSGDLHAAKLIKALRESAPDTSFEFFGAASQKLRDAGVEPIVNADDLSVVGMLEIGRSLPMFWKALRDLKRAALEREPVAVILVDFPDFNLKLAKSLKRKGLKVIYYISPQFWAWRKYRVKTIYKYVDLVITILPFEKDWYARQGIHNVEYVGSPLAKEVRASLSKQEFCSKHDLDLSMPIISLLPGSRHKEIVRILPLLLEGGALMEGKNGNIQFIIALASGRTLHEAARAIEQSSASPKTVLIVQNETYDALNASDAAAVTSGTATLETGIIGTPMVIVYKTSALNYALLRPMISVEHFGLVNLIAGERVAKELIQGDFTPPALSKELLRLLEPKVNRKMREKLKTVTDRLGHGGASKRAARAILDLLAETRQ